MEHNLNIQNYKIDEIFDLFQLNINNPISLDDLKRSKKIVLMTHPDKSHLSPDYFLFYKKAFEVIVKHFESHNRQNKVVPKEKINYNPEEQLNDYTEKTNNGIKNKINKLKPEDFNIKFNRLFEDNMASKPDASKNEWFVKDTPIFDIPKTSSVNGMNQAINKMKEQTASLIQYRGVQNLQGNIGTGLYDELENDPNIYVTCDPFSKLKFDDLRKVHKDQTILPVSERDFNNVKKYSSVDSLVRDRGSIDPLTEMESQRLLKEREQVHNKHILNKQHIMELRTQQMTEKNKRIMSQFLLLK